MAPLFSALRAIAVGASATSTLFDFDLLFGFDGLGPLGGGDLQDALVETGVDLALVDRIGQPHRAREAAEAALAQLIVLLLLLALVLLLALDRENAVGERHREILLFDARQIGLDHDRLGVLVDIEVGHHGLGAVAA